MQAQQQPLPPNSSNGATSAFTAASLSVPEHRTISVTYEGNQYQIQFCAAPLVAGACTSTDLASAISAATGIPLGLFSLRSTQSGAYVAISSFLPHGASYDVVPIKRFEEGKNEQYDDSPRGVRSPSMLSKSDADKAERKMKKKEKDVKPPTSARSSGSTAGKAGESVEEKPNGSFKRITLFLISADNTKVTFKVPITTKMKTIFHRYGRLYSQTENDFKFLRDGAELDHDRSVESYNFETGSNINVVPK